MILTHPSRAHAPKPDGGDGRTPEEGDEGYSTFRPSPVGEPTARNPKRAGASTSKPLRERAYESFGGKFETPAKGPTLWERILFGRVSTGQLAQFCRQFASYLSAGVDFIQVAFESAAAILRHGAGADPGPGSARDPAAGQPSKRPWRRSRRRSAPCFSA